MDLPGFYNHVVNVGFDKVVFHLVLETVLDGTLIHGPTFLSLNDIVM
jgi:hypothetical protein